MREENRWLFSPLCCLSGQKELIHRNLCILDIVVAINWVLMPVLAVSQLPIQTCCQLLRHRTDEYLVGYLVIVEASVLRLSFSLSNASKATQLLIQVLVGGPLNGAHRLLCEFLIEGLIVAHSKFLYM